MISLIGKTEDEAIRSYHDEVNSIVADFHKDYSTTNRETIDDFFSELDDETLETGEMSVFEDVNLMNYDDFNEDVSRVDRYKTMYNQVAAKNLRDKLKEKGYSDPRNEIFLRLLNDFVREALPDVNLSDKQVNNITQKACYEGQILGRSLILEKLSNAIDALNKILNVEVSK